MAHVTHILSAIEAGEPTAAAELLPLVYDELRQLAAVRMAEEKTGHTLQATALVHEAYLRLVGSGQSGGWNGRGHFFAAAAEAMRRILVENARRKGAQKRGGGAARVPLDGIEVGSTSQDEELLAIDDALSALAAEEPDAARLIQLRYFGGLTVEDAAEVIGISRSTAYEQWAYARARLRCLIQGD